MPGPSGQGAKQRSGATPSEPRHLCRGVEGLTNPFNELIQLRHTLVQNKFIEAIDLSL